MSGRLFSTAKLSVEYVCVIIKAYVLKLSLKIVIFYDMKVQDLENNFVALT